MNDEHYHALIKNFFFYRNDRAGFAGIRYDAYKLLFVGLCKCSHEANKGHLGQNLYGTNVLMNKLRKLFIELKLNRNL